MITKHGNSLHKPYCSIQHNSKMNIDNTVHVSIAFCKMKSSKLEKY